MSKKLEDIRKDLEARRKLEGHGQPSPVPGTLAVAVATVLAAYATCGNNNRRPDKDQVQEIEAHEEPGFTSRLEQKNKTDITPVR